MPRKPGKLGTVKGETITIRVNPKTKFALDLLARKKHSSISSVVMNVIEPFIKNNKTGLSGIYHTVEGGEHLTRGLLHDIAWDPRIPHRLVKLALAAPDLLTSDEDLLWNIIKENKKYWSNDDNHPDLERICNGWETINQAAKKQAKFL